MISDRLDHLLNSLKGNIDSIQADTNESPKLDDNVIKFLAEQAMRLSQIARKATEPQK